MVEDPRGARSAEMQKASVRGLAFGSWERATAPPPVPTPAPASPPAVAATAEPAPASPDPADALALAAAAFHQGSASHAQLRHLCKSVGLRTSFDGASSATLASLLAEVLRYNGAETALAAGGGQVEARRASHSPSPGQTIRSLHARMLELLPRVAS